MEKREAGGWEGRRQLAAHCRPTVLRPPGPVSSPSTSMATGRRDPPPAFRLAGSCGARELRGCEPVTQGARWTIYSMRGPAQRQRIGDSLRHPLRLGRLGPALHSTRHLRVFLPRSTRGSRRSASEPAIGEEGGTGLRPGAQGTTQTLGSPGCSWRGVLRSLRLRHLSRRAMGPRAYGRRQDPLRGARASVMQQSNGYAQGRTAAETEGRLRLRRTTPDGLEAVVRWGAPMPAKKSTARDPRPVAIFPSVTRRHGNA